MRLEELIGRRLARYDIIELLGRGGMAAVYRARDTALQRDVALKVLYPHYTYDQGLIERFQREAVVAARLDHPGIVPIYDVGEADGLTYIAMKLLGRRSLADLLRERDTLTPEQLAPIVDQIAAALDYAHQRGVVHRDIKPANIILDEHLGQDEGRGADARAVITDFGIARSLDTPGTTGTGMMIGTPDYMAPEQVRGERHIDGRTDVYALGVLIYRALTGRRPFEGTTQEVLIGHLEGAPVPPSQLDPSLPPAVDQVVRRAMSRRPEARYQTAGELARALRQASGAAGALFSSQAPRPADLGAAAPYAPPQPPPRYTEDDATTVRGEVRPHRGAPIPPPAVPRRPAGGQGGVGLVILGALLALLLVGGGLMMAQRLQGAAADTGGVASPAPTIEAVQPTEPPLAAETPTPTPEPSAEPTAEVTASPTRLTATPTRPRPTATATPSATQTATASPTQPTATATATGTLAAGVTPTACPVQLVGGFGTLWTQNDIIQQRLGCPTRPEIGGEIAEQPFERGSMYYFGPLEQIYMLIGFETGTWRLFPQSDLIGLPTPTPAPDPGSGMSVPIGGFGLVWGTFPEVREALGLGTLAEAGPVAGARQPFERGTMIWSETGLRRGKSIYVLYSDGTFERYDDPNP
ncbi:MAG: hypothetical protein RLZZ387_4229 [Chloroflexota bacterium]